MSYTDDQIEAMTVEQCLSIWRFSPVGSVPNDVMEKIGKRMAALREQNPGAFVAASKALSW